jgi:hypothetical protein
MTQGINTAANPMTAMQMWQKTIELNRLKKEQEASGALSQTNKITKLETEIKTGRADCQTCASRRYVDRSDDPSVSFQTPTHVSPTQSAAAVMGHEMEHVSSENAKAKAENREVVYSSVSIQYAMCPECGVSYAAGGETRTVTKSVDNNKFDNLQNTSQGDNEKSGGRKLDKLA